MDNQDNLDNVAGRDDAASLNPPTGYEKKLAGEKGADKLEGKVEGLGKPRLLASYAIAPGVGYECAFIRIFTR